MHWLVIGFVTRGTGNCWKGDTPGRSTTTTLAIPPTALAGRIRRRRCIKRAAAAARSLSVGRTSFAGAWEGGRRGEYVVLDNDRYGAEVPTVDSVGGT